MVIKGIDYREVSWLKVIITFHIQHQFQKHIPYALIIHKTLPVPLVLQDLLIQSIGKKQGGEKIMYYKNSKC